MYFLEGGGEGRRGETRSCGSDVELAPVGGEGVVGSLAVGLGCPAGQEAWVRWKEGGWLLLLERVAADRQAVSRGRLVQSIDFVQIGNKFRGRSSINS